MMTMSPAAARTTANVILAAAAGALAFVVVRNRVLRGAAWRLLSVTVPVYLAREARDAWASSSGARP